MSNFVSPPAELVVYYIKLFMKLPAAWNGYRVDGKKLSGNGYASFKIRILLPDSSNVPIAFKFMTINTAYNFFLNGIKIAKNGVVGKNKNETTPQYLPQVVSFMPDTSVIDVVLHISNFSKPKGGVWKKIFFGTETVIRERRERNIAFELFLLGSILIIAIHYLTIYLLRRKDIVSLFFSLFCFSIALRTVIIGERYLNHLFEIFPWELIARLEYWTMHLSTAFFAVFIYSLYPKEYSIKFLKLSLSIAGMFFCGILFLPSKAAAFLAFPYEIIIIICSVYILYVVTIAMKRKRESALFILLGCVFLFITLINDVLYEMCLIETMRLISFGLFIFLFSMAILLSKRSAHAHTKIEMLSENLEEINIALNRFVPNEFLDFLDRDNIVQIQLGDQVLKQMTILFSDIRSFTSISEGMSPQENFNFINSYLEKISPAITLNNGFIDKYVGDAIMALFPHTTDNAIQAAIDMQRLLNTFNINQNRSVDNALHIGIGMHTGSLILGTIGNEHRMETTVISDTVNIASRMERLTKIFGAQIIVSKEVIEATKNNDAIKTRNLGIVQVKGKNDLITILELLDGLSNKEFDLKSETINKFEEGVTYYQNKQFKLALEIFKNITKLNSSDRAAHIYCEQCENIIDHGIPETCEGAAIINFN